MSRLTTYTAADGAKIINARRVGATLREAAAAANVPWDSAWGWVKRGRRWNRGNRDNIGDAAFAEFAADMDAAPGVFMTTLKAHRAKAVDGDGRLAHDIIKHEETKVLRNEELRLLKARAQVEENRAAGTHVEHVNTVVRAMTTDEIRAEARRLAREIEGDIVAPELGAGEAPTTH